MFAGRTVHYLDLSEEPSTSHDATTACQDESKSNPQQAQPTTKEIPGGDGALPVAENIVPGKEPFVPLLTDDEVSSVSDNLLKAALDSLMADSSNLERFGEPTSDTTVKEHSRKGCVFS